MNDFNDFNVLEFVIATSVFFLIGLLIIFGVSL